MEDNSINQQIALELLEEAGAIVTPVSAGTEAIAMLEASPAPHPFDLVLMDVHMPDMDGFETTKRIRENPRFTDLPIVAMTAHATAEERIKCLQNGMNDHISKPLEINRFFSTLRANLHLDGEEALNGETNAANPEEDMIIFGLPKPKLTALQQVITPPASPDATPCLPDLPDVDVKAALAGLNGNVDMYSKILRQFLRTQSDAEKIYTAASLVGDGDALKRVAHTLRGLGGSIGATLLAKNAGELENILEEDAQEGRALAEDNTFAALTALLHVLQTAFPDENAPPASGNAANANDAENKGKAMMALAEFVALLRDDDAASANFMETHEKMLQTVLPADVFKEVRQAVSRFELEDALRSLKNAEALPPA